MNIFIKYDEFNINYLHFLNTKKNLLMDGNFTKVMYSNEYISTNGLYIVFNNPNNITESIKMIETDILIYYKNMYNLNKKIISSIRSYKYNNEGHVLFKISGIWETESEIGITYKFLL